MSTIERIRSSFARQGLMQHLGATLTRIEPGNVIVRLAESALEWKHRDADSSTGVAALVAKDLNNQIRGTVHHLWAVEKIRRR